MFQFKRYLNLNNNLKIIKLNITTINIKKEHFKMTLLPSIERLLNSQLIIEAEASQLYLSWGSWSEKNGLPGISNFFYEHSNEERTHLIKMIHYINKRGGNVIIPAVTSKEVNFQSILPLFHEFLIEEEKVTHHINEIIHECIQNKDYITHDFLQWFVAEQIQEEALVKDIIDRLNLIGDDKIGMYTFDRDIMNFRKGSSA